MLAKDPDNLAALTALVIFIYRFQPAPATADEAREQLADSVEVYLDGVMLRQILADDERSDGGDRRGRTERPMRGCKLRRRQPLRTKPI